MHMKKIIYITFVIQRFLFDVDVNLTILTIVGGNKMKWIPSLTKCSYLSCMTPDDAEIIIDTTVNNTIYAS